MNPYYDHGGITIYHAKAEDVIDRVAPIELLLTDPPYGLGRKLHDGGTWSTAPKYDAVIEWDKPVKSGFLRKAIKVSKHSIIWGGNCYSLPLSRCWLAWNKPYFPTMADMELAWTSFDMPSRTKKGNRHADGVNIHPTQKPIYLMTWCLTLAMKVAPFESVTDLFCGSGTTLVAAKAMGLKAVGVEASEKYCEIAARRLSQEVFDFA